MKFCSKCGARLEEYCLNGSYKACLMCNERYYDNPIVGVAVVYLKGNKILLGKRSSSYKTSKWCIPCGYLESHEDVKEGARREFKEETSIDVQDLKLLDVKSNTNKTVGVYYLAGEVSGELKADDYLSEVGFYNLGDLPEMAFKSDLKIIKELQKIE